MMDTTTSRAEFEAEFRKQHAGNAYIEMLLKMYNHGTDDEPEIDYYSLAARDAWKWWKASRESLVVELPEPGHYDHITQFAEDVNQGPPHCWHSNQGRE